MPLEDFRTYDETDENNKLTVAENTIVFTAIDLTRIDTAHVSKDLGAGFLSGDFEHKFECWYNDPTDTMIPAFWAVANAQIDWKAQQVALNDAACFYIQGAQDWFYLQVLEGGAPTQDSWVGPNAQTWYYVTIARDDGGGGNNTGQYTAEIRTGSHSGALQDTLTVDCAVGEQNDFQYVFAIVGYDDGAAGHGLKGQMRNLDLQLIPAIMTLNTGHWGNV